MASGEPDYKVKVRRGRVIHVHKQVLLWRKRMQKKREKAAAERPVPAVKRNFFTDEE